MVFWPGLRLEAYSTAMYEFEGWLRGRKRAWKRVEGANGRKIERQGLASLHPEKKLKSAPVRSR